MDINNIYKSNSNALKVEDLKGKSVNLRIEGTRVQDFDNGQKIVLEFENTDKSFVLNKTNANMIAMLINASDTRQWIGRTITVRPDKTQYQGELVDCIRVAPDLPESDSGGDQPPVTSQPAITEPVADDPDDIPF